MLVTPGGQRATLNIFYLSTRSVPDISLILHLCNTSRIKKLNFYQILQKE